MQLDILMVEDSSAYARLTEEAFRLAGMQSLVNAVSDGEEAIAYLRKEGKYAYVTQPDLILLDLNLPKKSGWEVLGEIKNDSRLKYIPVIVLTTSEHEKDILMAFDMHVNAYIRKPFDIDEYISIASSIGVLWFSSRPPQGRH